MQQIALNDLSRHLAPQREALMQAIARVVDSGWFVLGPELVAFEREFAAYCGVEHAVGVANGTDAIELALRALGVAAGDEVILAANAGMYSTTALRSIGAAPVYVDVDDRHLVLQATGVEAALTSRTRAIVATHLYGRMAPMKPLRDLADRAGVALVEDCAQAHGASQSGHRAGSWGDAAAFSFYPTKNLGALGDAGMVTCAKAAFADRVRRLRQYGWDKKYISIEGPARNSRLDEMQAAVLRVMLPLVDTWNARRREIARRYSATTHANLRHPDTDGHDYVAHLYVVRSGARDSLRDHLTARGIASDIHYPLLDTQQPALQGTIAAPPLPVSALAATQVLSLPCYPELTDAEVGHVCAALAAWRS
jgi:dTDP-3-amino-2,3,6-trideoxy-4-keto-D-glucose/dTDP-3-amino-3,4,6-trideoxy-alpha-D-glucose/dTDP-2,6-dideoxy-D-kanosamine transaminase